MWINYVVMRMSLHPIYGSHPGESQRTLFTMSEPTINTSTSLQLLRQTYGQQVLKTVIPRNTDIKDAHFNRQDVFAFNPHAKAAFAYIKLISELFKL